MAVNKRYYHDFTAPVNGHRYRVVITPWGYDTLALGTQPAFGAGSSGDYYQIPQGVFPTGELKPSASFDDLPIGLMDSPGISITLDYGPMAQLIAEGATALSDLWSALQSPEQEASGIVSTSYTGPDPWVDLGSSVGAKIRTGNYVELLTDGGNSALSIGSFKVVGAWVQHIVDEPEESYNPLTGSDTLKIELTGAFRYAAEVVTPYMIQHHIRANYSGNVETVLEFVDSRWSPEAGVTFQRLLGDLDGIAIPRRQYLMYRLVDLVATLQDLMEQVYSRLMRASATFIFSGGLGSLAMFDWVDLREQTTDPDGAASATSVTVPYFPGLVEFEDDTGVYVDGWLYETTDAGKDKLFGYASAYELVKSLVESTATAGTLRYSSDLRTTPSLSMIGMGEDPDGLALPIDADSFKGTAYVMQRARRLTAARAELVGTGSGDANEVTYRSRAVANDSPRLIPVVFNCLPQIGERNDWNQMESGSPGITVTMRSSLAAHNTLFYKDGSEMIRCHHYVGVSATETASAPDFLYYTTNGLDLPTPGTIDSVLEDVWYPWRLWALQIQQTAGLSYAACAFAVTMFGHQQQTLYPTTVAIENALPEYMGSHGAFADGEELTGQARHATYPGFPILIKTELDITAGTSTVELLGLGGIS